MNVPKDRIEVINGRVKNYVSWLDWNGHLIKSEVIIRTDLGVNVTIHDPEHGDFATNGEPTEQDAFRCFHPDIAARLAELFELQNASTATVRALGFTRFQLELA